MVLPVGRAREEVLFNPADPESENEVKRKAGLQGRAAHAHGYRGKWAPLYRYNPEPEYS